MNTWEQLQGSASRLGRAFGEAPEGAVVLGSGLSGLLDALEGAETWPFSEVGLASPGVDGHAGLISVGRLGGARVVLLGGRLHVYEGHPLDRVVLGVRALALWGVKRLVLTSAVGAVDPALRPGGLLRVVDHINLMGRNPLVGPNLCPPEGAPEGGPWRRFPDMGDAYSRRLGALADRVAAEQGVALPTGVYAAMLGPSYETPAEIRMLRVLGASVVGMSTVPEVIAAVHAGLEVVAFSVISNLAAGMKDERLMHEDVKRVVAEAAPVLSRLVAELVRRW